MTSNQYIEKKLEEAIEYAKQGDIRCIIQIYYQLRRLERKHGIKIEEKKIRKIGYSVYNTAAEKEKQEAEEFEKKGLNSLKKASLYLEIKYKQKAELIKKASGAELEALIGSMK